MPSQEVRLASTLAASAGAAADREGLWKQGAAYPLVRGLVVEDFGLELKNFLAHSIKLAYVPGLLVFTDLL